MPAHYFKYILFCLFVSLPYGAVSQKNHPAKKLSKKQFVKDSLEIMKKKRMRPQVRFDNRMTYHNGQILNLNGIDAGVLLQEKLRLTGGYYFLNDELSSYQGTPKESDVVRSIKLQYGSIQTEFIYLKNRYLSLGMPLDFGFGRSQSQSSNRITGEKFDRQAGFVVLTDFGLSAVVKPFRALGIRGAIGYRKLLINRVNDLNFNGVFTSIGISVDVFEIIKDVRMFHLKRAYKRGNNLENAVNLITD